MLEITNGDDRFYVVPKKPTAFHNLHYTARRCSPKCQDAQEQISGKTPLTNIDSEIATGTNSRIYLHQEHWKRSVAEKYIKLVNNWF